MQISEPYKDQTSSGSISSPADSLARTSRKLESAQDSLTQTARRLAQVCGLNSPESFARFDPATFSLRTRQGSLLSTESWPAWSGTWPDAAMWDRTSAYGLLTSEPAICESESSLWPTATANDDGKTPEAHLAMKRRMGERDGTHANRTAITSLSVKVQAWWPTQTWMMPNARDWKSETGSENNSYDKTPNLSRQVYRQNWPTPMEFDHWMTNNPRHDGRQNQLPNVAASFQPSPPVPATQDGPPSFKNAQTSRRRLNPRFVEWLMGLPIGWTEL